MADILYIPLAVMFIMFLVVSGALVVNSEKLKRANYVNRQLTLQLQFQGVIVKVIEKPNDVVFTVDFTDPDAKLRAEKAAEKYMHDRWMAKGRALMGELKTDIESKIGPFTPDEIEEALSESQEEADLWPTGDEADRILAMEADLWPTGDELAEEEKQKLASNPNYPKRYG